MKLLENLIRILTVAAIIGLASTRAGISTGLNLILFIRNKIRANREASAIIGIILIITLLGIIQCSVSI